MRLRQRALRGIAATATATGLVLALAGCVGGDGDDSPSGPNGYTLGATLDDVRAWWDVSESTGAMDVIMTRAGESQPIGVCLGGVDTVCAGGDWDEGPYLVYITEPAAAAVELTWSGTAIEMEQVAAGSDDQPAVFIAHAPPTVRGEQSSSYAVRDAAGEVIASR